MQAFATKTRSMNGTTNPTMMRVTPDMAAQWLDRMKYQHQRVIRQHHVEYLAEEMRRGRFLQGTLIHFVSLGGEQSLVDGQHRLWAVVTSGIPQSFTVLVTPVDSDEDAAWIYGNTDIGMKRVGADLYGALDLSSEFDISKRAVSDLSAAIGFMNSGCIRTMGGSNILHRDDLVQRMRLYVPYMREYILLVENAEQYIRRAVFRTATLSTALLTLRFSKQRSEIRGDPSVTEFWRGAIFDDGIAVGDPRKVANRHLLNSGMLGGATSAPRTTIITASVSCRTLVNCFNAYMERRSLTFTRVPDHRAPLNLYGTPNDPAQWF